MRYFDYTDKNNVNHHYGLFVSFYRSGKLKISLVENEMKKCDLTIPFRFASNDRNTAYVDTKRFPEYVSILEAAKVKTTGQIYENQRVINNRRKKKEYEILSHYEEYDFTAIVNDFRRQYKLDKVKPGIVNITDSISVNTAVIFYCYKVMPSSKFGKTQYFVVCIDEFIHETTEENFEKLIKVYNIPQFKRFRHEPHTEIETQTLEPVLA